MKHLLVLSVFVCVVAFVAAQETSEEEVAKLSAAEVSPIRVPAPTGGAPVGDDTVSFDEMIHKLSDTMERFKALYDSRKGMIETLLSHEEGTEAWDIARITLRSMTGELKEIADEINMITTKMATLRDKKHEARISSRSQAPAAGEAEKELGVDLA